MSAADQEAVYWLKRIARTELGSQFTKEVDVANARVLDDNNVMVWLTDDSVLFVNITRYPTAQPVAHIAREARPE